MNSQHMHHIRAMWDEINSLHLSYLQTEECLKKIGEQARLKDVIRQYLNLVPHLEKFFFPKISYVLHNSVRDKKDFSPFKAISAWSALAKYAHNILTQPWRKEFYAIQKYGGYFSHVIKEVLVDWEVVFELMGYNIARDVMILQEPIDSDKITIVARDCFIAQVECQIMMKIYASVFKIHNACTWHDILEFRESHICSAEQAIKSLCAIYLQRQQDELVRDSYVPPGTTPYGYTTLPPFHVTPCLRYHNDYKPNSPYGASIINIPPHSKINHESCDFVRFTPQDYNYPNCPKHMSQNSAQLNESGCIQHYQDVAYGLPYSDKPLCPQYIYPNNSQYLGMDERDHCSNCHVYNYGTMYPFIYGNNKYIDRPYDYHRQKNKHLGKYDNSLKQNTVDNQSVSRKNKDFYSPSNVKCAPVTVTDLENAMKAFSYDFDKNNISDNEQPEKLAINNPVNDNLTLPINNSNNLEKRETVSSKIWECKSCTFHNSNEQSICALCAKSKNSVSEKPLISGGRECPQCTLVNERDALACAACRASLKDSPTYI